MRVPIRGALAPAARAILQCPAKRPFNQGCSRLQPVNASRASALTVPELLALRLELGDVLGRVEQVASVPLGLLVVLMVPLRQLNDAAHVLLPRRSPAAHAQRANCDHLARAQPSTLTATQLRASSDASSSLTSTPVPSAPRPQAPHSRANSWQRLPGPVICSAARPWRRARCASLALAWSATSVASPPTTSHFPRCCSRRARHSPRAAAAPAC